MAEKRMVYGKLFSNGQAYTLLNPQPVVKDTCWQDNTYAFFVANAMGEATTIVTNDFVLEYAAIPESMMVTRVVADDDPVYPITQTESDNFRLWDEPSVLAELLDGYAEGMATGDEEEPEDEPLFDPSDIDPDWERNDD